MPKIEISQSTEIAASIHIRVESDQWNAMSDEEKRKLIDEKLEAANQLFANNALTVGEETSISVEIYGPTLDQIDLEKIEVYDPNAVDVPSP